MNILFYSILFIIGSAIGSYWVLQSKKISKNLDMKKIHYSNRYNGELVSKLTYMIIGGLSSVILANILKINVHEFGLDKIIIYVFSMLYISSLILIAGIDRNYSKIEKSMIAFGIVSSIVYMLYLFIVDLATVYLNVLYLGIYILLLVIDTFLLRKYAKDSYIINLLMLLTIILVFTNLKILIYTLLMALIAIIIYALMINKKKKKNGNKKLKINQIPVAYFVAASNIMVLFMIRIFESYLSK